MEKDETNREQDEPKPEYNKGGFLPSGLVRCTIKKGEHIMTWEQIKRRVQRDDIE